MFEVINEDTKTMPVASFLMSVLLTWDIFHPTVSVYVAELEQVNICEGGAYFEIFSVFYNSIKVI